MVVAKSKKSPVKKRPCTQCGKPNAVPPARLCPTCKRLNKNASAERRHDAYVQETYGLSEGEYKLLKKYQGGVCAICGRGKGKKIRLAVDHDHATGLVRGLLCKMCNYYLLGKIGHDDVEWLQKLLIAAIKYLEDPPYKRMRRDKAWQNFLSEEP